MLPPKSLRIIWVVVAIFVTFILVSHVYMGEDQPYTLEKVDLWQPATGTRPQYHVLPDAHNLQSADAFLPHFKAVMELPGYTVRTARRTCPLKHGEKVNFQWEENGPGKDWITHDVPHSEVQSRRREWKSFVGSSMVPYSKLKSKFSGRGLVIVAGNQDTLKGVEIILRSLIRLGCSIAVELHYWGDELAEEDKKGLRKLYRRMSFNDLSGAHNIVQVKKDGAYINYQFKTAALVNSRFAEPILLDSDNIPVIDPALLYASQTYREFGTIFWPDIARTRPQNPAWAIFNTPVSNESTMSRSGNTCARKTKWSSKAVAAH